MDKIWYQSTEHQSCFRLVFVYVFVLYLIPSSIRKLPRNHPTHIKYRLLGALAATIASLFLFYYRFPTLVFEETVTFLEIIGFRWDNTIQSILLSICLMVVFYAGPLLCQLTIFTIELYSIINNCGVIRKRQQSWTISSYIKEYKSSFLSQDNQWIIIFRNVLFAPITEEIVFRALLLPYLYGYYSDSLLRSNEEALQLIIMIGPLYFGIAHLHHLFEALRSGQPVIQALITTTFQMIYTSIFGSIAIILLLRTGNIMAPITSHIFCNIQGLPDIDFMKKPGDPYSSGKLSCLYGYRYLHLLCHAVGLALFAVILYPMTGILIHFSPYRVIN